MPRSPAATKYNNYLKQINPDNSWIFTAVLHELPEEAGYDEPAWSTALAQHYLIEAFDIAFSRRHVRRLLHKAGVSSVRPRPEPASADEEEREEFEETVKKVGYCDEDTRVITIDQTRKTVGADLYAAWYPVGERPTVGVSASREGVNLLGAVTELGETAVLECGGHRRGDDPLSGVSPSRVR